MASFQNRFGFVLLAAIGLVLAGSSTASAETSSDLTVKNALSARSNAISATIRGSVLDENGNPVANAIIALLREGAAQVKQIRSQSNGNFVARVAPGRYTLTAMASGFSVASLANVDVDGAEQLAFRFNLVRTGNGNTLPERRADRRSAKWRLRSNAARRTIYQNTEGTGETVAAATETPETETESSFSPRLAGYAETYFASSANSRDAGYFGINFAAVQPISENLEIAFAGQTKTGDSAAQRLDTIVKYKINDQHKLNLSFGAGKIGNFQVENQGELGQLSFQALDEWRVKDNLILVVGFDYSRFTGASSAERIAPRFGVQFDANARTRVSAAYTVNHEPRTWQQAVDLEDNRILFRAPDFDAYAVADDSQPNKQVLMPRMRRLEVGVERVLDNSSSVEALAFFDATTNRGVSFVSFPLDGFSTELAEDFAGDQTDNFADQFSNAAQNGNANGVRLIYSRRLNQVFDASLGYAFGSGQQLSSGAIDNPQNLFETRFFQTLAAELSANFGTGTNVKTVWRYQPRRAVFAIDPFAGRINSADPNLSVLVTQKLPTWGLPIRARAMLDARNLLDVQTATDNGETVLKLNSARRVLRGGIAVRF